MALDPTLVTAAFAEDGELEDPVGSPVRRGHDEIARYWAEGFFRTAAKVEIDVVSAFTAGNFIAAHWRMRVLAKTGREASADGIDVLQIGVDGLITRAQGYWDQEAFRQSLKGG